MFVGHFAVAFAAKRAEPRLPLVLLVVAVAATALPAVALTAVWAHFIDPSRLPRP